MIQGRQNLPTRAWALRPYARTPPTTVPAGGRRTPYTCAEFLFSLGLAGQTGSGTSKAIIPLKPTEGLNGAPSICCRLDQNDGGDLNVVIFRHRCPARMIFLRPAKPRSADSDQAFFHQLREQLEHITLDNPGRGFVASAKFLD
jgi:hypothetical protein